MQNSWKKKPKYNARKVTVDGITFASAKESRRYKSLKLLEASGGIEDLELQPVFLLQDKFKLRGKTIRKMEYKADFRYRIADSDVVVVEDAKGMRTEAYKIKKKLFLKRYGEQYLFYES